MSRSLKVVGWAVRLFVIGIILAFLHYYLPHKDVVRIVGTDVKRKDLVTQELKRQDSESSTGLYTRDVRYINTVWPNGVPRVYRNEETGWNFPWYFKFDSGNIQSKAQDLTSTQTDPRWAVVTYYGWRIEILSRFPNAVEIEPAPGPDHMAIPWFSVVFLLLLAGLAGYLWWLWRRFLARLALDDRFENASEGIVQITRWTRSSLHDRTESILDWLDTWKPKHKRRKKG